MSKGLVRYKNIYAFLNALIIVFVVLLIVLALLDITSILIPFDAVLTNPSLRYQSSEWYPLVQQQGAQSAASTAAVGSLICRHE